MVTDYSTTTMVSQTAPYQHHAYKTSAHYSPKDSGANTPMNLSPTSPRTSLIPSHYTRHTQIAPRKGPIYVPAALRKTENPIKPVRQSPPTVDGGLDNTDNWSFNSGFASPSGEGTPTIPSITTEDLNSIYNDMSLSPVAGPITKNHWQIDSSASVCTALNCQTQFGFFNRRHHCRKCGNIFCWQHSAHQVRLNEHALFHPEGELQRSCDRCYHQFHDWEKMRSSRQNSESSGSSSNSTHAVQIDAPATAKRPENQRVGSLASSFQGAWNWSTF